LVGDRVTAGGIIAATATTHEAAGGHGGQTKTTVLEEITTRNCLNDLPFPICVPYARHLSCSGTNPAETPEER
ncbi:MAG: hypothetical protein SPC25_06690, partial [Atopobiaceae bacterium]|nr:hypothetical protein [Atopobiaceae bacterium]